MDETEGVVELIGRRAEELGVTVGVAESLTGGLVVQALARGAGASEWLRGGIVAYARNVKRRLLKVRAMKVVSREAAVEMAAGVRKALDADVAVALTGVGGPDEQDGEAPGTVWIVTDDGLHVDATLHHFTGDPREVCEGARRAALDALCRRLVDDGHPIARIGA